MRICAISRTTSVRTAQGLRLGENKNIIQSSVSLQDPECKFFILWVTTLWFSVNFLQIN